MPPNDPACTGRRVRARWGLSRFPPALLPSLKILNLCSRFIRDCHAVILGEAVNRTELRPPIRERVRLILVRAMITDPAGKPLHFWEETTRPVFTGTQSRTSVP